MRIVEVRADGWEIKGGVVQPFVMYGREIQPFGDASLRRVFQTKIGEVLTLEKCRELTRNIREEQEFEPSKLRIELGARDYATYAVKIDRMQIYRNRELVYENWQGVISRDPAALADSRM